MAEAKECQVFDRMFRFRAKLLVVAALAQLSQRGGVGHLTRDGQMRRGAQEKCMRKTQSWLWHACLKAFI